MTVTELNGLLDAIAQRDSVAFRQFYEQTKSRVFNTALSYVQNHEDAEEIMQDVYVEVHASAGNFKGESSAMTWVYRIVINKSLDFLKHKRRQKRFAFLFSLFDSESGAAVHEPPEFLHPGVVLERQENAAILFGAVNKLAEKQKTAYVLTRVEGLSNIEAAQIMDVSVGAVESLLTRANENLKKQLSNWYDANRP